MLDPHQNPKFWGIYLFYPSAISWVVISHQEDDRDAPWEKDGRDDPWAHRPIACLGTLVPNVVRV